MFMLKELLGYQTHKCNKEKYICPSRIFNGTFSREIIADPSSDFSRALPGGQSIVWSVSELHNLIAEVVFKHMDGVLSHFKENSRDIEGLLGSRLMIATNVETIYKHSPMLPVHACCTVIIKVGICGGVF